MKKRIYVKPSMKVYDIPKTMMLCSSPYDYPGPFEAMPNLGRN